MQGRGVARRDAHAVRRDVPDEKDEQTRTKKTMYAVRKANK